MLENPFLPAPSAASAWAEGFTKGFVSVTSPAPSENVGAEDINAFNEGIAAGEEGARVGVAMGNPCIPALEEQGPGHVPGITINAAEIAHGAWEARHIKTLAGGIAGIIVALVELACTLPVHIMPPDQVLPNLGEPVVKALALYGVDSLELFCGAGLDANAADCEICVSPLFTSVDLARQAAIAMNRSNWLVASWRTDQSGSFRIVDSG